MESQSDTYVKSTQQSNLLYLLAYGDKKTLEALYQGNPDASKEVQEGIKNTRKRLGLALGEQN